MFCGFGAVVLLVLIVSSQTVSSRQERMTTLQEVHRETESENDKLTDHIEILRDRLNKLKNRGSALTMEKEALQTKVNRLRGETITDSRLGSIADQIRLLEERVKELDQKKQAIIEQNAAEKRQGSKVRAYEGEGNRQYLTGLKLGGRRVLIMVDSSASMLAGKIVDIVMLKVRDETTRRSAPKWRQTLAITEWLIANMAVDSSLNIFHFNRDISPLNAASAPTWIPVTEEIQIDRLVDRLQHVAPADGTNLERAFAAVRDLSPRPDNIILITDGLPTQGGRKSRRTTVSGRERLLLFEAAVKRLPRGIPVNIILLPLEGDPLAAVSYWKLAFDTGGSFLTPAGDWP